MSCFLVASSKFYSSLVLPSCEEIKKVSLEEIDSCFNHMNPKDRINFLATIIRCANKLSFDSEAMEKSEQLAAKVAQLTLNTPHTFFESRTKVENSLLPHVSFELTMHSSKEAYELFAKAVKAEMQNASS